MTIPASKITLIMSARKLQRSVTEGTGTINSWPWKTIRSMPLHYRADIFLAHETAHVVARDTAVLMSREIGIGILLSAAVSEDTSRSVRTAADLTRQILGLRFSRRDEKDADLAGLDYMVRAGYDPIGMVETMQILQNQQKTRPIEFFSTHPIPENRMAYLKARIQSRYRRREGLRTGKEDFHAAVLKHLKDK